MTDDREWLEDVTGDGWECAHCGEWKVASRFNGDSLVCLACEDDGTAIAEGFDAAIEALDSGSEGESK